MLRLDANSRLILLGFSAEMDDQEGDYQIGPLVHDTSVDPTDEQAIYVVGQWESDDAAWAAAKVLELHRAHATLIGERVSV